MIARRSFFTTLFAGAAALIAGRSRAHATLRLADAVKIAPPPGPEVSSAATAYWMGPDNFYAIKGGEIHKLNNGRWHRYGVAGWAGK